MKVGLMINAFSSVSWEEAARSFFLHKRATRSFRTALYYRAYVRSLATWANSQGLSLERFTKRHLDEYLVYRSDQGLSPTSLRHDALVATVFTEWCYKNDLIDRDPLAEYKVRSAPKPYKYMPKEEDMQRLLSAIPEFYDASVNLDARFSPPSRRSLSRERTYAVILLELDSACRIGEIMNFKLDDYRSGERKLFVTKSKGREPRTIPVSQECARAIDDWLKVRARVMKDVPKAEDEGWLFISATGGRVDEGNFLRGLKKIIRWAGLPEQLNNHSQRRFSLNRLVKVSPKAAKDIAGHKSMDTTMIYTEIDDVYNREVHEKTGVLRGLLTSNRTVKRRRLV